MDSLRAFSSAMRFASASAAAACSAAAIRSLQCAPLRVGAAAPEQSSWTLVEPFPRRCASLQLRRRQLAQLLQYAPLQCAPLRVGAAAPEQSSRTLLEPFPRRCASLPPRRQPSPYRLRPSPRQDASFGGGSLLRCCNTLRFNALLFASALLLLSNPHGLS